MNASDERKQGYNHILKYTGLLGGVQGLTILLSVVRNKCVALLIGTVGVGLSDMLTRMVEFLGNTTNFGISFSAVRHLSRLYEQGDGRGLTEYVGLVRSWTLIAALLGTLTGSVLSPWLSRMLVGDTSYTVGLCGLSPMVGLLTLIGGEMAILKGIRRLRRLATVIALSSLTTLAISVSIYWLFGTEGVIPVLLLTTAAQLGLLLRATLPLFPYRIDLTSPRRLRGGAAMIRLGLGYILAGIMGSGAEMAIRTVMLRSATTREVGLYSVGFTLTVAYSRMVFVAMDADYFPRLSAVASTPNRFCPVVNRQIDVCVLLITPLLIALGLFLPQIVNLLYTPEFMAAVPMSLCALFYMFFKALTSPIAYLALARGDSLRYLTVECVYDVAFVALVVTGYSAYGLAGAGCALSAAGLFDFLLILTAYSWHYKFRFELRTLRRALLQGVCLAVGVAAAWSESLTVKYGLGGLALLSSAAYSWRLLSHETDLVRKLRGYLTKFSRKS